MHSTIDHGLIQWLLMAIVASVISLHIVGRASSAVAVRRTRRALDRARRASEI